MSLFPDVIRIESVGRCNFRCTHCPVGIHGNTRDVMSYDTFVRIFDRLPHAPRVLVLYHGGEPLLNRELEKIIAYAKSKGVQKTVFNSNVALLTVDRAKKLQEAGLDELRVSFDGSSPEENDKIRIGSNFKKHALNVLFSADYLNITIYNVKFDGNPEPAKYLRDFFGDKVKYRTELARVWSHEDKETPVTNEVTYCKDLWETFSILSDGNVVTCCEDLMGDYTYGNVLKESPLEIWNRMQYLRDDFSNKNYPELCKHCWVVTGSKLQVA